MKKGTLVKVIHCELDKITTANGISSKYDEFVLIGEGIPEEIESTNELPPLYLIKRVLWGENHDFICPSENNRIHLYMFGGNFAWMPSHPEFKSLKIHDRVETVYKNQD